MRKEVSTAETLRSQRVRGAEIGHYLVVTGVTSDKE
jgi:hypothetical protein